MNAFYFYLFILVHPYLAMWWKSFELAERKSWEAFIPGYNYFVAFKQKLQIIKIKFYQKRIGQMEKKFMTVQWVTILLYF